MDYVRCATLYGPPICLNCNSNADKGRRGLCQRCHRRKNIRLRFPSMKLGRRPDLFDEDMVLVEEIALRIVQFTKPPKTLD